MKTNHFLRIIISSLVIFLSLALFSFTGKPGGDELRIYLNGKQVLQQFRHIDKSIKSLSLTTANDNDKIDVYYFHCGHCGTGRTLTIRDENNKVLKEFKFPDASNNHTAMSFTLRDIPDVQKNK